MEPFLRRLFTVGWRRGRAGSRTWMIVASVAGGLRLLYRVTRSRDDVLYRTRAATATASRSSAKAPAKR